MTRHDSARHRQHEHRRKRTTSRSRLRPWELATRMLLRATAGTHNVPRPPERNSSVAMRRRNRRVIRAVRIAMRCRSRLMPAGPAPSSDSHGSAKRIRLTTEHMRHAAQHQATSATRPPASSHHSQPSEQSNESKSSESPKSNPGMASAQVPRPPAGYSYHAAPAYTASSYSGRSASYGGNSRSYSAPASTAYGSSRGTL